MIHRIDTLSIELQTPAATQDARILHDTLVEPFKLKVLAVIEAVLERFEIQETISINRINIAVKGTDEAACLVALEHELIMLIRREIAQAPRHSHNTVSGAEGVADIVRFLALGFFSNIALQEKWEEQRDPAYFEALLQAQITKGFAVFLKRMVYSENAVARLLYYFPACLDVLKKMMGNPGMHTSGTFRDSCRLLCSLLRKELIVPGALSTYLPDDTCSELLQSLVQQGGSSAASIQSLSIPEQLQEIIAANSLQYPETIRVLRELTQRITLPGDVQRGAQELPVIPGQDRDDRPYGSDEWPAPAEALLTQGSPWESSPLIPEQFLMNPDQLFTGIAPGTAVLFPAGVLFVHPFLPELFDALGLLSERRFVNVAAQIKAVSVLKEIGWGSSHRATEKDLFLYKLLCGLDPEAFIKSLPDLSAADCDCINHYLELLIQEWGVLKSTSLITVRANFLSRRAYVLLQDIELIVRMPSSVFDILLEQYPWNLSIIKLPWLPRIISLQLLPSTDI